MNKKKAVYARVKRIIADIKNMPISDVRADQTLRGDLRFTEAGVRALTTPINKEFADVEVEMLPDEVARAKTVRDLAKVIWEKVPEHHKSHEKRESD